MKNMVSVRDRLTENERKAVKSVYDGITEAGTTLDAVMATIDYVSEVYAKTNAPMTLLLDKPTKVDEPLNFIRSFVDVAWDEIADLESALKEADKILDAGYTPFWKDPFHSAEMKTKRKYVEAVEIARKFYAENEETVARAWKAFEEVGINITSAQNTGEKINNAKRLFGYGGRRFSELYWEVLNVNTALSNITTIYCSPASE